MSSTLDKLYGILEKNGLNGSSTQRSSNGHKVSKLTSFVEYEFVFMNYKYDKIEMRFPTRYGTCRNIYNR
ncbi:hypothetical protein HanXRQr2_Chr17g0795271 [Helianthus annuus]|uniref:Uncharacterized protein n=1 Tax=Helianthus annuus TaxID=4232 RepID=A0A9K3GTE7_HELAN|nr:hypothetical protein HanXRQr2_Chr17g0795261 [Helianthus annuus]KAF5754795.1 hypothetical protein HanXRQr2_Chr17g0795271 [Helianthus annuus]